MVFFKILQSNSLSFVFCFSFNLPVISVIYFCLLSSFFNYSMLNFSVFCKCLLVFYSLRWILHITRKWSVSQSAPLKLLTSDILHLYLFSINLWSIWFIVHPSGDFQVYLCMFLWRKIVVLTIKLLDAANEINLWPLLLLSSWALSSPIVGTNISVFPIFAFVSPSTIFITLPGNLS